jgi:hypothetical protein
VNGNPVAVAPDGIETHVEGILLSVRPKTIRHSVRPGREERNSVEGTVGLQLRRIVGGDIENVLAVHQHSDGAVAEGGYDGYFDVVSGVGQANNRGAVIVRTRGGVIVNLGHSALTRILEAER